MNWKPIETAPKDGTPILGASVGDGWIAHNIIHYSIYRKKAGGSWKTCEGRVWEPDYWQELTDPRPRE